MAPRPRRRRSGCSFWRIVRAFVYAGLVFIAAVPLIHWYRYVYPDDQARNLLSIVDENSFLEAKSDEEITALVSDLRKALTTTNEADGRWLRSLRLDVDSLSGRKDGPPGEEAFSMSLAKKNLSAIVSVLNGLLQVGAKKVWDGEPEGLRIGGQEEAKPQGLRITGVRDLLLIAEQLLQPYLDHHFGANVFPSNMTGKKLSASGLEVLLSLGNFGRLAFEGGEKLMAEGFSHECSRIMEWLWEEEDPDSGSPARRVLQSDRAYQGVLGTTAAEVLARVEHGLALWLDFQQTDFERARRHYARALVWAGPLLAESGRVGTAEARTFAREMATLIPHNLQAIALVEKLLQEGVEKSARENWDFLPAKRFFLEERRQDETFVGWGKRYDQIAKRFSGSGWQGFNHYK